MLVENLDFIVNDCSPTDVVFHEFMIEHAQRYNTYISRAQRWDTYLSIPQSFEVIQSRQPTFLGTDSDGIAVAFGEIAGCIYYIVLAKRGYVSLWISASSVEQAKAAEQQMRLLIPERIKVEDPNTVEMRFWNLGSHGARSDMRSIETNNWVDVARNYPKNVRPKLDDLMKMGPPSSGGKLVLWHGEPGGGKTNAIQAIAKAWNGWCNTEYVVDPEAFFGSADYLIQVLNYAPPSRRLFMDEDDLYPEEEERSADKWRLIVVEDAGQFVRKNADSQSGQAFGRLLNLTDGLIGQGMKVMVLVTTNEPVKEMHPALKRPGRCLADIKFEAFTSTEASKWLGYPASKPMSLAELYAQDGVSPVTSETNKQPVPTGQYL